MPQIQNAGYSLPIQVGLPSLEGIKRMPQLSRFQYQDVTTPVIRANAITASGTSRVVSVSTDAGAASNANIPTAELPIGLNRYEQVFTVSNLELATARSYGVDKVKDLLKVNVLSAANVLCRDLCAATYAGDAAVVGFANMISTVTASKSTVTYAGLTTATNPRWTNLVAQNPTTPGTNRPLTLALMDAIASDIISGTTVGVSSDFTAVYCHPDMANKYRSLYTQVSLPVYQPLGNSVADLSAGSLAFRGRPVIEDARCPLNRMFFVNEPNVSYYNFAEELMPEDKLVYGEDTTNALSFKLTKLAKTNPDATNFVLTLHPQMMVRDRISLAVLSDISL
jgi:hypothetical protein